MAIDEKKIIPVINKSSGDVTFIDQDTGRRWDFSEGETKKVPYDHLLRLSYNHGGRVLLRDYLTVMDEEAVTELIGEVEPEYFYTKKEIANLLEHGSLDALEDCLNFAPTGVIDMIKDYAVTHKLNAVDKRELIQAKTGFNVDKAIEFSTEDEDTKKPEPVVRKVAEAALQSQTTQGATRKAPTPTAKVGVVNVVKVENKE